MIDDPGSNPSSGICFLSIHENVVGTNRAKGRNSEKTLSPKTSSFLGLDKKFCCKIYSHEKPLFPSF